MALRRNSSSLAKSIDVWLGYQHSRRLLNEHWQQETSCCFQKIFFAIFSLSFQNFFQIRQLFLRLRVVLRRALPLFIFPSDLQNTLATSERRLDVTTGAENTKLERRRRRHKSSSMAPSVLSPPPHLRFPLSFNLFAAFISLLPFHSGNVRARQRPCVRSRTNDDCMEDCSSNRRHWRTVNKREWGNKRSVLHYTDRQTDARASRTVIPLWRNRISGRSWTSERRKRRRRQKIESTKVFEKVFFVLEKVSSFCCCCCRQDISLAANFLNL